MAISPTEHRVRQFLVRYGAPYCFRAIEQIAQRAETRIRRTMAIQRHVRGAGIEVGAAASPAIVPPGVRVRYVDKYDLATLRADPELAELELRAPDIIDSADTLYTLTDGSQNFVLGFSMMEHVQDPVGTLKAFTRVTAPGGTVVISAPDKRFYGPDTPRPLTTFEHLVRDHEEGPGVSLPDHFREVARLRHALDGAALEAYVAAALQRDAHTHFHVWDARTFLDFLLRASQRFAIDFEVVEFAAYGHESLAVLRVGGRTANG